MCNAAYLKEVFYYLKKAGKESRVDSGCKCRNVVRICVQLLSASVFFIRNGNSAHRLRDRAHPEIIKIVAGIGYSSMQQLTRIAFSELKIALSFVKSFTSNEGLNIVVESSIGSF